MTPKETIELLRDALDEERGGEITPEYVAALGWQNVGGKDSPIWQSPGTSAPGPVCHVIWEPLMGCDGWSIGYPGYSGMMPPPSGRRQLLQIIDALRIPRP